MRNSGAHRDVYALIGEIIVEWATVENIVDQTATMIEWRMGMTQQEFTNMSAFRSFKERKGHVRRLIQTHYSGALPALDRAFQKVALADPLRHALSHERVSMIQNGDSITVQTVRPGYRRNDQGQTRVFTLDAVVAARDNLKEAHYLLKLDVQRDFVFKVGEPI
jgi:hypothetical protein